MFSAVSLFRLYGIPIKAHWSLVLLFGLIVSTGWLKDGPIGAVVIAVFVVAIAASVLAHEMGHVLAARSYGVETSSVVLSPLGGMAFIERDLADPRSKAVVAAAGPAVSLVLWGGFETLAAMSTGNQMFELSFGALAKVNMMLFAFNMLPAYPMDGGRLLFAAVEAFGGRRRARKASLFLGTSIFIAMAVYGLWTVNILLLGIAFLMLFVSWAELDGPVFRQATERATVRDLVEASAKAEQHPEGVFVAFDGSGRHFAYARHWNDCPGSEDDQKRVVASYGYEARKLGGRIRFLTPEEYMAEVVG